ncbi:hypothetical protein D9758_001778 [Tetrapyrgos nigripes]|uniref:SH3 domain-containing protein n=1 Tax=Tetrapyrgos nigripes TaxID=182062 RepID=A0A8H5GXI2_9AGAR|nr:hypothetical protein D9758_001778 [Tetrapyrgos nigripes]
MVVARHLPAVRAKRQQATPPTADGLQPVQTVGTPVVITIKSTFSAPVSSVIVPSPTPPPPPPPPPPPVTSSQLSLSLSPLSSQSTTSVSTTPAANPSPSIAPSIGNTSAGQDNTPTNGGSSNSNGLSGGAIAGIVLGIVLLLLLFAFFLYRRLHSQRRQNNRGNATWAKGGIEGGGGGMKDGYAFANGITDEKFTAQASNLPPLQPVRGTYTYPTSDYTDFSDVAISPHTVPHPAPIATTPLAATPAVMTPMNNSSKMVTVRGTFVPSLPDELRIVPGDSLWVVQEYDDGWSLCIKTSTCEEGMVPSECYGDSTPSTLSPVAGRASEFGIGVGPERRASSLVGSGIHGRM